LAKLRRTKNGADFLNHPVYGQIRTPCTLSLARCSEQTKAMGTLRFLTTELCSRVDNVLSSCWNVRWLFAVDVCMSTFNHC